MLKVFTPVSNDPQAECTPAKLMCILHYIHVTGIFISILPPIRSLLNSHQHQCAHADSVQLGGTDSIDDRMLWNLWKAISFNMVGLIIILSRSEYQHIMIMHDIRLDLTLLMSTKITAVC